jgi:hypothetical protein
MPSLVGSDDDVAPVPTSVDNVAATGANDDVAPTGANENVSFPSSGACPLVRDTTNSPHWCSAAQDSDSMPSLVGSSNESATDSDEEDYRQLEVQEEALRSQPASVSEGSPRRAGPGASGLRARSSVSSTVSFAGGSAGTGAQSVASIEAYSDTDESLPELVASSSSGEESDEEQRPRRNVRARHAHVVRARHAATGHERSQESEQESDTAPLRAQTIYPGLRPSLNSRVIGSYSSMPASRPPWAGVAELMVPNDVNMPEPFPRAWASSHANMRYGHYYSRWNSAAGQHAYGGAHNEREQGAAHPQVVGAIQVLDGNALFAGFSQGNDDIVIGGGGEDTRGFRSLRPIDLLSSILGSQGLRVDGTEGFFDGGGALDPIMQVSAK